MRMRIVLSAVLTLFTLAAAGDPLQAHWRVTLKLLAGDDPAVVARQLAATYRGTLLTPVDDASSTFAIAIGGSSVQLLRADHRVARIEQVDEDVPARVKAGTNTAAPPWKLGDYDYDGSGNITKIGTDLFVYDPLSRLRSATMAGRSQTYTYDAFGNMLTMTTDGNAATKRTLGVDPATNRITRTAAPSNVYGTYDNAGNMKSYLGVDTFEYDGVGMVTQSNVANSQRAYLYSVSDERVATLYTAGTNIVKSEWTLRDSGGAVLRRFTKEGTTWTWAEDYIYRDGSLLAANKPTGTEHVHLDHLGTARLITTNGGVEITRHTYLPFGEEATSSNDPEKRRFTGHEKDDLNQYYMHARYYLPYAGRFFTVDPEMNVDAIMRQPQAWNRYAYVMNNPINKTDPTGRCVWDLCVGEGTALWAAGAALAGVTTVWLNTETEDGRTNAQVISSSIVEGVEDLRTGLVSLAHRNKKRPSTADKHAKGEGRLKTDKGGEKADWDPNKDNNKRRPPNKRPDWWPKKGPWPPKFVPVPVPDPPAPMPPNPTPPPPPKDKDKEREPIVLLNRNAKDSNARYAV